VGKSVSGPVEVSETGRRVQRGARPLRDLERRRQARRPDAHTTVWRRRLDLIARWLPGEPARRPLSRKMLGLLVPPGWTDRGYTLVGSVRVA